MEIPSNLQAAIIGSIIGVVFVLLRGRPAAETTDDTNQASASESQAVSKQ